MDFARDQAAMVRTAARGPPNFPLGLRNCEGVECAGQWCIDTLLRRILRSWSALHLHLPHKSHLLNCLIRHLGVQVTFAYKWWAAASTAYSEGHSAQGIVLTHTHKTCAGKQKLRAKKKEPTPSRCPLSDTIPRYLGTWAIECPMLGDTYLRRYRCRYSTCFYQGSGILVLGAYAARPHRLNPRRPQTHPSQQPSRRQHARDSPSTATPSLPSLFCFRCQQHQAGEMAARES